MSKIDEIRKEMMTAMKNKDKVRKDSLSMLLSALKNAQIDKREELTEAEEVDAEIDMNDVRIDITRSSGCGGQGVNTTDSAVRLTHIPTGIVVYSQTERSQIKNKEKAFKILASRLYDYKLQQQEKELGAERKSKIGTGDRSEKIRTYNYPQNRVTDHRIGFTLNTLDRVMQGDIDKVIEALITEDQARKLRGE